MNKYSVILRAYNAARYVSKSIESIIRQSYEDWELIIVNDGSSDNTGEICEKYALEDERIKVVSQENKGCLLSTLTGVQHATGNYICLVDSDDWYEDDYLEKVNNVFSNQNVDMVVVNYKILNSANKKEKEFCLANEDCLIDAKAAMRLFFQTTNYALWNKVVAKEKIKYTEEELAYYNTSGKTTNFGDDLYLLMPVLCGCEKIYFLSECLYNYVIDEASISHQSVKDNWNELLVRNRLMQFTYDAIFDRNCMDEEIEKLIQINTVKILITDIMLILKSKKFNRKVLKELKNNVYYKEIVMKTDLVLIKKKLGKKRAIAFGFFNLIIFFS